MPEKAFDNKYRATIMCIDSYIGKVPEGRLYNCYAESGAAFSGLVSMLLQMEKLLDSMKFPQPFNSMRAFGPIGDTPVYTAAGKENKGKLATFSLKILFRQSATWQGTLTWLESGQEESFRSVLELVHLIDSALSEQKDTF